MQLATPTNHFRVENGAASTELPSLVQLLPGELPAVYLNYQVEKRKLDDRLLSISGPAVILNSCDR